MIDFLDTQARDSDTVDIEDADAVVNDLLDVTERVIEQRNEAVDALAALLAAFPDLGRGFSTAEQQAVLAAARAIAKGDV